MRFLCFCMNDACRMYEMKMNNLLVNVKIFSLCSKETLFQAEFQQYKWKWWKSFLTNKLLPDGGFWHGGFYSGDLVRGVYVIEPPRN